MDAKTAIAIIENEKQCVKEAEFCTRDCANCCLVKKAQDILDAFDFAIRAIKEA